MKVKIGLRECLIAGIAVVAASLLLYKEDRAEMFVTASSAQAVIDKEQAEAIESGMEVKKKIALTFDDGPHPYYTEQMLDGLKERGVKATFFVMGKKAEENPELIKRMQDEGHLIGNHTYSHLQLKKGEEEQFKQELQRTSEIIKGITGQETEFVRPPFGTWEKRFENELNMFPVLWTIDPLDWSSTDAKGVTKIVVSKARENAIILMHDQYKSTITAALSVIDILLEEGYEFVTVDQILFD